MAEEYISPNALSGLYGGDTTSSIAGITSLLTPFKGIFERLKSGQTTANDVNAALGVLGLIMPSLNRPQTAGWKGSIDLNRQFTRTPIAQPEYKPYAQSAAPVMGRQFFTSSYSAPGATPAASGGTGGTTGGGTVIDDPTKSGVGGALARGGIASLRKFDGGGEVEQTVKQPKVVLFGDSISSAVGYGKDTNKDTKYGSDVASILSKQLGVPVDLQAVGGATTQDALTSNYLPGGSFEKYLEDQRPDVVLLRFGAADAIRLNDPQQTLSNIQNMVDLAKSYGATPVLIGVSPFAPGNDVRAGNIVDWSIDPYLDSANKINAGLQQMAGQNQLPFVDMRSLDVPEGALLDGVHPTADFGKAMAEQIGQVVGSSLPQFQSTFKPIQAQQPVQQPAAEQPVTDIVQTAFSQPAQVQQPQQPAALTGLAGSLPSGWSGYDAGQKIDWYNQNKVTPDQLLGAGVPQSDIDWMNSQGYLGSQTKPMTEPPVRPTGVATTTFQPLQLPQVPQTPPEQPVPRTPIPDEELRLRGQGMTVEAAQGGLMGLARGGVPRYLRGQTDGMADKIPSNIDGVQPAKLSHGEFVIPADVVAHLGNGNNEAGADVLYRMMDRVRMARTGTKKQGKRINPAKFMPGGIAGYAGGGAVAFPDGGEVKTPPVGMSTETNISSWAGPYVGDMLSKTSALTATPYQAYQGPLVAGTAPLQSKVFSGLEGLNFPGQLGQSFSAQGAYELPSMTPGGVTGQAGPTGIASQYMNPYLSAVLTPQLEELRRQSQITQMGTAGKLAQAGAYGGSRQAIMDAETQRNLLAEQNKAIGQGYANAYDRAMGQFNVEQGQAKTLADMMAGAGAQQRGIEQEGITALQKQYETELLDPYTKLRFQKEMLQGLPVATAATTANTSQLGEARGNLGSLVEALKNLGLT